ncbi:MAG TPA: alpha/beta hydrolase [Blastocatellia bacterium]|nr:alpha/beta hydrolase [Blastocatellia bacterium]
MNVGHLVLLPGLDGTGRLFDPLLKILPSDFTTSVVSYPTDRILSYSQLEPLVREALPADRPFAIVAESFSGPLAVMIAASPPHNLRALILSTSFISNPLPPALRALRYLVNPVWFRATPPRHLLRHFLLGHDCPDEVVELAIEVIRSVPPETLASRIRQVMEVNVRQELQVCGVPLLYLPGSRDRLVSQRSWGEISRLKPDAKCVEIDAPHLLLQRKPAEAFIAIYGFLRGLESLRY